MTPSAHPVPAAAPAPDLGGHPHAPDGAYPMHPDYGYGYAYAPPGRFTALMARLYRRFPVWAAPAAILACFLGSAALVLWSDPAHADASATPTCLVKLTTGLDCPGCGGTRAFWYLLHGNLPAAARHHALFVFAVPFLLYLYAAWGLKTAFGWKIPQLNLSPKVLGWFLG